MTTEILKFVLFGYLARLSHGVADIGEMPQGKIAREIVITGYIIVTVFELICTFYTVQALVNIIQYIF